MNDENQAPGLDETNRWYGELDEASYDDAQVDRWLARWFDPLVEMSARRRVLDLCCGDGVWSLGLLRHHRHIDVVGVDIAISAIERAGARAKAAGFAERSEFHCMDLEEPLPDSLGKFDLIFARGLFIFNQHDMCREGCLQLMEDWHRHLDENGVFYSSYGGRPELAGQYTAPEETRLPFNRMPRQTAALDFKGGKFNHSSESFLAPFGRLPDVEQVAYEYKGGRHALVTRLRKGR